MTNLSYNIQFWYCINDKAIVYKHTLFIRLQVLSFFM
jgi:hypothetical protein